MRLGLLNALLAGDVDWDGHMDLAGWGWALMAIGMVAFWALVALAILWLVRELGSRPRSHIEAQGEQPSDPEDILRRRLAEGEISVDEYRERSTALEGGGPSAS